MWVDGVYVKADLERKKAAIPIVTAVLSDGSKRVLSLEPGYRESVESWFDSMADEPELEMVVTDDSTDYSTSVSEAGLSQQQCVVHMRRTLGRAKGRLSKTTRIRHKALLDQLSEMVRRLPSDGARTLIGLSTRRRLPDELRWLVTHLLVRLRELTLHQRR